MGWQGNPCQALPWLAKGVACDGVIIKLRRNISEYFVADYMVVLI